MNKTLREQYFANEILYIGDIVEDSESGEHLKIIDRGSNYITVDGPSGVVKKWLNEVKTESDNESSPDFSITESGQIKLFGYETRNFDPYLSNFILEQFSEFDDLYSKHQIIKLLDRALVESDKEKQYDLLEKVSIFYTNKNIDAPIIVEGLKNELERRRIAEILATIADSKVEPSAYKTAMNAMIALKKKYIKYSQWQVLWPFLQLAKNAGIAGITQNLPFSFGVTHINKDIDPKVGVIHEDIFDILENNFEELVESLEEEDLLETFTEEELSEEVLSEEQLNEVLSITARTKMANKMRSRKNNLEAKRARALKKGATTSVLQARARRLAEVMVKRKMFRKPPSEMTRQDKERFEAGAYARRALIARLAQRLLSKVRAMQSARLHATNSAQPEANNSTSAHNVKDPAIGAS